jgi:hypothetical protein
VGFYYPGGEEDTTGKTLREQIKRSGSTLICNKQQLNTLFRVSLAGFKVY